MKQLCLLFAILLLGISAIAQKIHSPAELLKIMENSEISYEISSMETPVKCPDYSSNLNYNESYRAVTDSGIYTYKYSISDEAAEFFKKAEGFFQKIMIDSAQKYYKKTLEVDSSLYFVMTYLGQTFEHQNDSKNAIYWYKKAIEKNYIDYMAHWFLADAYKATGQLDKAVDEITIARILNRNNPRIKSAFDNIYKAAKRKTEDWYFNPQIELEKTGEKKVKVSFDSKWTGYAIAKAIWEFEPGYSLSMGVEEGVYSTIEDKECLISQIIGMENAKVKYKKDPQLRIMKTAAENKFLTEYILFEIVLPENPQVAFQLTEEIIESMKNYILEIRNP
ncbi:hypothetical protein SDC9_57259 [bioreactor metagenome]|uniref:Tetratricopeptide repeat protein n=1 Tax=bioreactor metagenome TaxID=1076179 RepID=A0A644X426_9ZZZZ